MNETQTRPIYEIAAEIRKDWGSKIYFGAKPYVEAMEQLNSITDTYICESAENIIRYFLSNASTWKGEVAKRIKAELKKMVGIK